MVGRDRHAHHPIESEVQQAEVHVEDVPKELDGGPLKPNHRIDNHSIDDSLEEDVGNLDHNLCKTILSHNMMDSLKTLLRTLRASCSHFLMIQWNYLSQIPSLRYESETCPYLSEGIGQSGVHSSPSLSIEDRPLNSHNGLNRRRILKSDEKASCVHRAHRVEEILLAIPASPTSFLSK